MRRRPVLLPPPWRQRGSIRWAAFQKGCGPCASHPDSGGAELPRGEDASFLSGSAAGFPRRGAGTLLRLWSPGSPVPGHQSHLWLWEPLRATSRPTGTPFPSVAFLSAAPTSQDDGVGPRASGCDMGLAVSFCAQGDSLLSFRPLHGPRGGQSHPCGAGLRLPIRRRESEPALPCGPADGSLRRHRRFHRLLVAKPWTSAPAPAALTAGDSRTPTSRRARRLHSLPAASLSGIREEADHRARRQVT